MFPKPIAARTGLLLSFVLTGTNVSAQPAKTTDEPIAANVYELARLEPTPARINQIKLPPGFRITRFAELENPRWLQVAPDGSIYVSQRDPGTLTLLKDMDGDGVADIQKVVAKKTQSPRYRAARERNCIFVHYQ